MLDADNPHAVLLASECRPEKIVRCDGCGGDITHEHQECVTWDDGAVEVLCDVCSGLLSADPIPSDL